MDLFEGDALLRILPDDPREVNDRLGALGGVLHELPVRDVARGHPARATDVLRNPLFRADPDQKPGEESVRDQGTADVPAQEARSSGDENLPVVEKRNFFHNHEMPPRNETVQAGPALPALASGTTLWH